MKAAALGLLAALALTPCHPGFPGEAPDAQAFILKLQETLRAGDFEAYLGAFAPELRAAQRDSLDLFFKRLGMETVDLQLATKGPLDAQAPEAFVQAVYQNAHSVMLETWQLGLEPGPAGWRIARKTVRGSVSRLYRVQLAAEPPERVDSVEVRHVDIQLSFRQPLVFYDNIPGLQTGLLIIGRGRLVFSPSDPSEGHQLALLYETPRLQDELSYAYIRCSPSFFERNITIVKSSRTDGRPATQSELDRAAAVFRKVGDNHFTIHTPVSPEPLSFLPQDEEAAIEFEGRKTGELAYVYSPFAVEEIALYNRERGRFLSLYSPPRPKGERRLRVRFGQRSDVDRIEIEAAFEPADYRLSARARVRIRAQADGLDSVGLKFNPDLEILGITDAERRELFFSQDRGGRLLHIYLLEPAAALETVEVEVLYRGRLVPPPQSNDAISAGQQSETVVLVGPRLETSFYGQSALWYPAPPDGDFFTARLKFIVPPGTSVVANGRLTERGTLAGVQRLTELDKACSEYMVYEIDTPVKALSFLAGRLSLTEEATDDGLPLSGYVASDVRWLKRDFLNDTRRILAFYRGLFGPFPFDSLKIVQRLWSSAGGHSPASFLVVNELARRAEAGRGTVAMVPSPGSPVDLSQWKDYFLAHELAHQWWGQAVTGATYRDQWLSEGLAQFAAALYLRSKHGQAGYSEILQKFSRWTRRKSGRGQITLGARLSYLDFEAYQAVVYDKAALVLNMLMDTLGEATFFGGLRTFLDRHQRGAADTGQFQAALEAAAGRSLAVFFDPWFNSHELADVRVGRSLEWSGGTTVIRLRLDQAGRTFQFPLWLSWKGEDGGRRRERVLVERRSQEFEIKVPGRVRDFAVNADGAVPGRFRDAER